MMNLGSDGLRKRVAIVGAGPLGLIATKNFVEEGFDVTTFERNEYVGGLWHITSDPTQTCVLPGTITNTSKLTGVMTDFPMPESYPMYPTGEQIEEYFQSYAKEFKLIRHIKFGTEVVGVSRDETSKMWRLSYRSSSKPDAGIQEDTFERLILATGSFSKPSIPNVKGIEGFKGEVLHSQAFKNPAKYKGKNVLVVGLGSTAADSISGFHKAGANKLIVSHRQKVLILPRITKDNKVLEFTLSFRLLQLIFFLQEVNAWLMSIIFFSELKKIQQDNFPGLSSHPAFTDGRKMPGPKHMIPTVSDDLAGYFLSGRLRSAPGIAEINGPQSVKFVDGSEATDIDLILFCTGLSPDLASFIPKEYDPYNVDLSPSSFAKLQPHYTADRRVARLYRGFMSIQCPHQLAFLGTTLAKRPAWQLYDLMTMALAQLWGDKYPMPSPAEINKDADAFIDNIVKLSKGGYVKFTGVIGHKEFDKWLNDVAGTGLYDHLGNWTNGRCWKLWWKDRELYNKLMTGILSAHVLRLFDTGRGRKPWAGARQAIMEANDAADNFGKDKA
ncbi:hypothetical protein FOMG_18667 [Fusarium oxysporum f. sp. melonis 26406]|nr:hypothetical protein FOMG_18667 [Fusarium oxysporum f. sp. melonis 26406]KAJ9414069.1 flavin-binding monooxygenase-like-domain-containing protein [Fusarium oxysporum]